MTQFLDRLLPLLFVFLSLGVNVFTMGDLLRDSPIFRDTNLPARKASPCIGAVNSTVRISRATLAWLMTVPAGSTRREVLQQLGTPYC